MAFHRAHACVCIAGYVTTFVAGIDGIVPASPEGIDIFNVGGTISSASISISPRPDGSSEVLSTLTPGELAMEFDQFTGSLSLIGQATPAVYERALSDIFYRNNALPPTIGSRMYVTSKSKKKKKKPPRGGGLEAF